MTLKSHNSSTFSPPGISKWPLPLLFAVRRSELLGRDLFFSESSSSCKCLSLSGTRRRESWRPTADDIMQHNIKEEGPMQNIRGSTTPRIVPFRGMHHITTRQWEVVHAVRVKLNWTFNNLKRFVYFSLFMITFCIIVLFFFLDMTLS